MLIDFHTHAFPPEIAERALRKLSHDVGGVVPQTEGTLESLKKQMDEDGVDLSVVLAIATNPRQMHKVNDYAVRMDQDERIIAEIENGTMIGYKYFSFGGKTRVGVHYRNGDRPATGAFLVKIGEETVGRIPLSDTADWIDAELEINVTSPSTPLYFIYEGEGMAELLFIYFR